MKPATVVYVAGKATRWCTVHHSVYCLAVRIVASVLPDRLARCSTAAKGLELGDLPRDGIPVKVRSKVR